MLKTQQWWWKKKNKKKYRSKKKVGVKALTKKVNKLSKKVEANTQHNWVDMNTPSTANPDVGSIYYTTLGLQNISYGTNDPHDRIGDVITLNKAKLVFTVDQSTSDNYNVSRFIMGYLPEVGPAAAAPTVTDILQTANVNAFYCKGGPIKWKKIFDFKTTTYLNSSPGCVRTITKNVNFKGLKIHYRPGSNSIYKNGIFLLVISDSSLISHPSFKVLSRLWFNP